MRAAALLISILALAGCAASVPATDWRSGTTPAGVVYRLPAALSFAEGECVAQIDSDYRLAQDRRYEVVVMPGAWVVSPYGWVVGLTETADWRVSVAYRKAGEALPLPALAHEMNHVRLYNLNGDADSLHRDASWQIYY